MKKFIGKINGVEYTDEKEFILASIEVMSKNNNNLEISSSVVITPDIDEEQKEDDNISVYISDYDIDVSKTKRVIPNVLEKHINHISDENANKLVEFVNDELEKIDVNIKELTCENAKLHREINQNSEYIEDYKKDLSYYNKIKEVLRKHLKTNVENETCGGCKHVYGGDECKCNKTESQLIEEDKKPLDEIMGIVDGFASYLDEVGFWKK